MRSLVVLLGCVGVVACSDAAFDVRSLTELEHAAARWDRFGPDSYLYAVARVCYCPVESTMPVRVRVEHGVAVERTYVASGEPVPNAMAHLFPTVEDLFDILRQAYDEDAHEVRVSYDPDLGYPTDFGIDYDEQVADEELGFQVTEAPVAVIGSTLLGAVG